MIYEDYIKSKEWKKLRQKAYNRAKHKCELCDDKAAAAHHIKYPKNYSEDVLDNILVICDKCHKLSHGIREDNTLIDLLKYIVKRGYLLDQYLLDKYKNKPKNKLLNKLVLVSKKFKTRVITREMYEEVMR